MFFGELCNPRGEWVYILLHWYFLSNMAMKKHAFVWRFFPLERPFIGNFPLPLPGTDPQALAALLLCLVCTGLEQWLWRQNLRVQLCQIRLERRLRENLLFSAVVITIPMNVSAIIPSVPMKGKYWEKKADEFIIVDRLCCCFLFVLTGWI